MNELRYWFAATCIWMFFFFNLERMNPSINIASFVYIYATAWAVMIILLPKLQRINQVWVFLMALLPYLVLKMVLGYGIVGEHLPISVLEAGMIGLTIIFVGRISGGLESAQEIIANLTIGHLKGESTPFETGQERLYQEIRRARHFERPAALLSISATPESLELSLDRFVLEAQRTIKSQFVSARIAQMLAEHLKGCDIITRRGDHFITLLPETSNVDVGEIVEKLKAAADKELNLELKIGASTFPDEAITFESMLERAERRMVSPETPQKDVSQSLSAATIDEERSAVNKANPFAGGLHTTSYDN